MPSLADEARDLAALAAVDLELAGLVACQPPRLHQMALVHAQQAAEKWLKALLASRGQVFPQTHDVAALLALAVRHLPELAELREAAVFLGQYATEPRYVVLKADPWHVIAAIQYARAVRDAVVPHLAAP